jgi:hypothetical protein
MHGPFIYDREGGQLAEPAMANIGGLLANPPRFRPSERGFPTTEYCIYKIDGDGRIVGPALRIRRESDEAAIATARRMDGAQAFDIWDGSRRVATVPVHGEPVVGDPFYF